MGFLKLSRNRSSFPISSMCEVRVLNQEHGNCFGFWWGWGWGRDEVCDVIPLFNLEALENLPYRVPFWNSVSQERKEL